MMLPTDQDQPYLLREERKRKRREAMLTLPHVQPLTDYLASVRSALGPGYEMPQFDPGDGGVHAKALFLLEAPGPKAVGPTSSPATTSIRRPGTDAAPVPQGLSFPGE